MHCVECVSSTDCLSDTQICQSNRCTEAIPCTSSRQCPGLVCSTALGFCVECLTDADCADTERCSGNSCVARPPSCMSDRDCSAQGLVCDFASQICVECVRDPDCGFGGQCSSAHVCTAGTFDGGVPVDAVSCTGSTSNVDVVLVVDNSGTMGEEQASLAADLPAMMRGLSTGDVDGDGVADVSPATSIHVGLLTTDMGSGGLAVPGCGNGTGGTMIGDDGVLQTGGRVRIPACATGYPSVFEFLAGSGASAATFGADCGCLLQTGTGTSGCGFEQPLESVLKGLSPAAATAWTAPGYVPPLFFPTGSTGHGDGSNRGLLRDDSVLAIVVASDESDCSTRDLELFDGASTTYTTVLNLRCFSYPGALHPVSRYVDGLAALRPGARRLVVTSIGGIPPALEPSADPPSYATILADPAMLERVDSAMPTQLVASCSSPGRGTATPPVRILQLLQELDLRGAGTTAGSICQTSYRAALDRTLRLIGARLAGGCTR